MSPGEKGKSGQCEPWNDSSRQIDDKSRVRSQVNLGRIIAMQHARAKGISLTELRNKAISTVNEKMIVRFTVLQWQCFCGQRRTIEGLAIDNGDLSAPMGFRHEMA
jgi:hypothetical protein